MTSHNTVRAHDDFIKQTFLFNCLQYIKQQETEEFLNINCFGLYDGWKITFHEEKEKKYSEE